MPESKTPKPAEKIKIRHKLSKQFTSHFATGAILSGPGQDGFYHMIFYAEVVGVLSETGVLVEHAKLADKKGTVTAYRPVIEADDIERFREDNARISMTSDGLRSLYDLLKDRFESGSVVSTSTVVKP